MLWHQSCTKVMPLVIASAAASRVPWYMSVGSYFCPREAGCSRGRGECRHGRAFQHGKRGTALEHAAAIELQISEHNRRPPDVGGVGRFWRGADGVAGGIARPHVLQGPKLTHPVDGAHPPSPGPVIPAHRSRLFRRTWRSFDSALPTRPWHRNLRPCCPSGSSSPLLSGRPRSFL